MPELTREEKLKLIEKLPQKLQDFLYSEDLGAFLFHLRYKYNLTEDKVSALARAIADIVLGIAPMTSLVREIIDKKIVADVQIAANIAQEVNTELLAPITAAPNTPPTPTAPTAPVPTSTPSIDRYREPTIGPEVVDLRNQPKAGPPRAETPPTPSLPAKPMTAPPAPPALTPKPITPTPPAPQPPPPQYIMRPSGLPPTDLPENVLDLRKDKGEF